jgi:UDP-glucose 4-epimerase
MVLPRLVDAALAGRPPEVYGDGRQQRCFAHVADVLRAILALVGTAAAAGRVFNVGSDRPISILDLARKVIAAVDPALEVRFISYREAYGEDFEDCPCRVPDLSRLREAIGFVPGDQLDRIIAEVIAWKRGT